MPRLILLSLLILSAFAIIDTEDEVLIATDDNIDEILGTWPNILIEFYAPWCGHCKKLAPEYAAAAARLKQYDPPIRIAKCDATENSALASKYSVESYPTLKYFEEGNVTEYTGGRTEEAIVSWIVKRQTDPLVIFDSKAELDQYLSQNTLAAVMFTRKDSQAHKVFNKLAKEAEGLYYALCTDAQAMKEYGVVDPTFVLFKDYDDYRNDYTGALNQEDMVKWMDLNKTPWVSPFNDAVISKVFSNNGVGLFVFRRDYEGPKYKQVLDKLAPDFHYDFMFSYADIGNPDNKRLSEYLGVMPSMMPCAVIVDNKDGIQKYLYQGEITVDTLKKFIKDFKRKKLDPLLKSEDLPDENYEDGVRVLVGQNFEEVVYDTSKDVLVEFYAPWCGHCKQLAPEYSKLANQVKDIDSIVIAKVDSTVNEVKGHPIRGYPTLKFFPANNKSGMDLSGRNAEDLLNFIKQNASVKIEEDKIRTEL